MSTKCFFSKVTAKEKRIHNGIQCTINRHDFVLLLDKCINLLKPLDKATVQFLSDTIPVSDVVHFFVNELKQEYNKMNYFNPIEKYIYLI